MRILITGGAGFVGSNLAIKFKNDNPDYKVVSFDNLKRMGSELNLKRLKDSSIQFIHGDVRNKEDLEAAGKFDLLIECSAESSVLAGFKESPEYLINTNLGGMINCLELVRKYKADIIFLSTSRVYPIKKINELEYIESKTRFELSEKQITSGVSSQGISEEFPLDGSRSLYGTTKLCSELLLLEYIKMYRIRGIINRCGLLTGPWQMGKVDQGVIVFWVAKHIYNGKLSYFGYGGKGKQVRDVLHVDDLYRLIRIQLKEIDKHNGRIYNVGGGKELSISLQELTRLCQELTKNKTRVNHVLENRDADIPYYVTDISKVNKATGWKPEKSLKDTVKEIADWITNNKEILRPILE